MRIACIGEAMVEVTLDADPQTARIGFAGDTLNTAIYLRRALGPGHEVAFVSMLGVDALSGRMAAMIEAEGISTAALARHPQRLPGLYAISTDPAGERSFAYWRESSAARAMFEAGIDAAFAGFPGAEVIYHSAITLAILPDPLRAAFLDWLAAYRAQGGRVVFDSNYRPRLWATPEIARRDIARAWSLCDIALPSVDDEMALFGDRDADAVLARLRGWGLRAGALKRGAAGPLPLDPVESAGLYPPAAHVVDTTAAGDSFNGAFLAALLTGAGTAAAMMAGHACAARVIGHRGAIVPRDLWDAGA